MSSVVIPGLGPSDESGHGDPIYDAEASREATENLDDSHGGMKRTAQDAGLGSSEPESAAKHPRHDDAVADLDPSVRERVAKMFEGGKVRRDEIDDQCLRELNDLTVTNAISAIDQFEAADMNVVRNKSGYLSGVITRLRRQPGPKQQPEIQHRLDAMFRARKLKSSDLDLKCYESMASMPVPAVLQALDTLASRDLRDIRNLSAFFSAQLRSAEKQSHTSSYPRHRSYDGDSRGYPSPSSHYPASSSLRLPPTIPLSSGRASYVHQGHEQRMAGVRVDEFHALADVACYVPAPVALKLQTLWDSGVKLVALLDDRSWEMLAELGAPEGLTAVAEVAEAMQRSSIRNINAYFVSVASKLPKARGPGPVGGSSHLQRHPVSHDTGSGYVGGYSGAVAGSGGYSGAAVGPYSGGGSAYGGSSYSSSRGRDDSRYDSRSSSAPAHAQRGVSALHTLSDRVRRKAEAVMAAARSHLHASHFDEGVCSALERLGDDGALRVLDEVLVNDLASVRNIPAYIMGICRRHKTSYR